MTTLTTVPNFIFYQGEPGDDVCASPIHVQYYNDGISLDQGDQSVILTYQHLNELFKEIKRHRESALKHLSKK